MAMSMKTLAGLSDTKLVGLVALATLSLSWVVKVSMRNIGTSHAIIKKWASIKIIIELIIAVKTRK